MPLHPSFALKPTFPLDDSEIRRRTGLKKIFHPLSLGALGGGALLGLAIGAGALELLIVLGVIGLGLTFYWHMNGNGRRLQSKVIRDMIAESNREQDLKLSAIVQWFRARSLHHYAIPLGQFLLLKKRIESSLHEDGGLTPAREQIDLLVDRLCAGVCRQFTKVSQLDVEIGKRLVSRNRENVEALEAQRSEILRQIMHAYNTLYETQSSILDLEAAHGLTPGGAGKSNATPPPLPGLGNVIDQLKEENEIARRVQERLHIDSAKSGDPDYGAFTQVLEAD